MTATHKIDARPFEGLQRDKLGTNPSGAFVSSILLASHYFSLAKIELLLIVIFHCKVAPFVPGACFSRVDSGGTNLDSERECDVKSLSTAVVRMTPFIET